MWLPFGLVEDHDTDGHVDNVAAFVRPGLVAAQTTASPQPRRTRPGLRANIRRARGAGLDVVEIPLLPYARVGSWTGPVPYLNWYVANELVVVPVTGHPDDRRMLDRIGALYDREAVGRPRSGARLRRRRRALHHPAGAQGPGSRVRLTALEPARLARASSATPTGARVPRVPAASGSARCRWCSTPSPPRTGPRSRRACAPRPARARRSSASRSSRSLPTSRCRRPGPARGRPRPGAASSTDRHTASPPDSRPRPGPSCTRRSTRSTRDALDGLGFNTAICVAPDGSLVARTRKMHIPVTAGYHEDRWFRPGDSGFPVADLGGLRAGVPDVLGPVVPRARPGLLARRGGGARVPDGDRLRARPPRLRHPTAVGAGDPGQRDRQRHLHGRGEPHRDRGAVDVLRVVVRERPLRPRARPARPATSPRCSWPSSTSTSAATGSRCSRSSPPAGPTSTTRSRDGTPDREAGEARDRRPAERGLHRGRREPGVVGCDAHPERAREDREAQRHVEPEALAVDAHLDAVTRTGPRTRGPSTAASRGSARRRPWSGARRARRAPPRS